MSSRIVSEAEAQQLQAIKRGETYRYPIIHEMPRSSHGVGSDHAFAAGPLWPEAPESMKTDWCPEQIRTSDT